MKNVAAAADLRNAMLIFAMALIAVAPMAFRGMPGGNDVAQNYEFAQTVIRAYNSGDLIRSFDGMANDGMGEVRLRVYPPAAYYALSLAFALFRDWYFASLFVFVTIFFLGGAGTFAFVNEISDSRTGLTAAALYTFSPFHLNEIYNNFLYSQFAAGAILPFVFWFSYRTLRSGRPLDIVLLGISYALLVLTHLPLAVIGSLSLLLFLVLLIRYYGRSNLFKLGIAAALGVSLCSFYWVRLLREMNWARHSMPEYFSGIWSYKINFLISERTFSRFLDDDLSLWFGDLMLAATVLICIPGIIYVLRSRSEDKVKIMIPVLCVFVFGILMATPFSEVLWDNVATLQKLQFPWRWLSVISFSGAVVGAIGLVQAAERLGTSSNSYSKVVTAVAALPFIILSVFVMRAGVFTKRAEFNEQRINIESTRTYDGWWPIWARPEAFNRTRELQIESGDTRIGSWTGSERLFSVSVGEAQNIGVKLFYYPHWRATVNGSEVEVGHSPDGTISLPIGSGNSDVALRFVEPFEQVAAKWVSIAGWATAIFLLILSVLKRGNYGHRSQH